MQHAGVTGYQDQAGGPGERRRRVIFALIGLVVIAGVFAFGYYHFGRRPVEALDTVKSHEIPGRGTTIGEGILQFVKDKGVDVDTENFDPRWGAEEVEKGVWKVSYVFEVGREAEWISWRVDTKTGKVTPVDEMAEELWEGD